MRKGFTMIELIFVIVIIGILAAVAIPKLAGTAKEARKSTAIGFLGTLNRTVGPAMWAEAVTAAAPNKGRVIGYTLSDYTEVPDDLTAAANMLAQCKISDGNASTPQMNLVGSWAAGTIEEYAIDLYCEDGSAISSPRFAFDENGSTAWPTN